MTVLLMLAHLVSAFSFRLRHATCCDRHHKMFDAFKGAREAVLSSLLPRRIADAAQPSSSDVQRLSSPSKARSCQTSRAVMGYSMIGPRVTMVLGLNYQAALGFRQTVVHGTKQQLGASQPWRVVGPGPTGPSQNGDCDRPIILTA